MDSMAGFMEMEDVKPRRLRIDYPLMVIRLIREIK